MKKPLRQKPTRIYSPVTVACSATGMFLLLPVLIILVGLALFMIYALISNILYPPTGPQWKDRIKSVLIILLLLSIVMVSMWTAYHRPDIMCIVLVLNVLIGAVLTSFL